ncbi:hypothetical protein [Ruminococcus sp.]|uniref:hypothetical protein n=1 Tax=Ruminococcus sp. TaxID=41978 RepID=UPI00262DA96B|nr:hypothetical protein [Ruminococcus sp.]MDD6989178.1 hypothetical protein [Ruminococcus sp.]MDY6202433.1 hypothetical protein [Ruminococcus sp.]
MFDSIFGDLFDFNNDGEIDAFERGAELAFLDELMNDEKTDVFDDSDNWDSDD